MKKDVFRAGGERESMTISLYISDQFTGLSCMGEVQKLLQARTSFTLGVEKKLRKNQRNSIELSESINKDVKNEFKGK